MPEPESEMSRGPIAPDPVPDPFSAPARSPWFDRALEQIKAHEKGLLMLGGIAQLLFLAAMALPHVATAMTGETILLRVAPVDPRDLFRGDYVILSYEISRVPPGGIIDNMQPNRGVSADEAWQNRPVYVGLEPEADGKHYRGNSVSFSAPASGKFIRGTLENAFRITFGLESYYVQEGRGKEYEDAIRTRKLSAVVALTPDGSASLRDLIIETD